NACDMNFPAWAWPVAQPPRAASNINTAAFRFIRSPLRMWSPQPLRPACRPGWGPGGTCTAPDYLFRPCRRRFFRQSLPRRRIRHRRQARKWAGVGAAAGRELTHVPEGGRMSNWPKVFRDPIHNLIAFENTPCDRLLLDLINTREVQRLRRIQQLGMSDLVFPGANHSRFAHSLGVLHTARLFLDQLQHVQGNALPEDHRTFILAAALLHDVGHGPFSHVFEQVTGQRHEAFTRAIIHSEATEVHQRLSAFDPNMPEQLSQFFDEDADEELLPGN